MEPFNIYFIWIVDADSILALKGTAAHVDLHFFGQKVAEDDCLERAKIRFK